MIQNKSIEEVSDDLRIQEEICVEQILLAHRASDKIKELAGKLTRGQDKVIKVQLLELSKTLRGTRTPLRQLKLF